MVQNNRNLFSPHLGGQRFKFKISVFFFFAWEVLRGNLFSFSSPGLQWLIYASPQHCFGFPMIVPSVSLLFVSYRELGIGFGVHACMEIVALITSVKILLPYELISSEWMHTDGYFFLEGIFLLFTVYTFKHI